VSLTNHVEYGGVTGLEATLCDDKHGTEEGVRIDVMTDEKNMGCRFLCTSGRTCSTEREEDMDESKKRTSDRYSGTEPQTNLSASSMLRPVRVPSFPQVLSMVVVLGVQAKSSRGMIDSQSGREERAALRRQTGTTDRQQEREVFKRVVPEGGQQQQQGQPDGDPDQKLLRGKRTTNTRKDPNQLSTKQAVVCGDEEDQRETKSDESDFKASYNVEHFNNILKKDSTGYLTSRSRYGVPQAVSEVRSRIPLWFWQWAHVKAEKALALRSTQEGLPRQSRYVKSTEDLSRNSFT